MDKSLLVAVFVPTTDEKGTDFFGLQGNIATGYPVGEDLILTVRHVLYPEPMSIRDPRYPIKVRWHYHRDELSMGVNGWITLESDEKGIAWPKDAALTLVPDGNYVDALLLRCPFPSTAKDWGQLSSEQPTGVMEWESEGFPQATKYDAVRNPCSFGGRCFSKAENEDYFELSVLASPREEEDWRGASGMPIFVGSRIFGIARSVPKRFHGDRLHAVPSWRLLSDPEFCEVLGVNAPSVPVSDGYDVTYTGLSESKCVVMVTVIEPGYKQVGTGLLISGEKLVCCAKTITIPVDPTPKIANTVLVRFPVHTKDSCEVSAHLVSCSQSAEVAFYKLESPLDYNLVPLTAGSYDSETRRVRILYAHPTSDGSLKMLKGIVKNIFKVPTSTGQKHGTKTEITVSLTRPDKRPLLSSGLVLGAPIFDLDKQRIIGICTSYDKTNSLVIATAFETIDLASKEPLIIRQPPELEAYLTALFRFCSQSSYLTLPIEDQLSRVYVRQDIQSINRSSHQQESVSAYKAPQTVYRLEDAAEQFSRLIVIGGPGAGKSTLLRNMMRLQVLAEKDADFEFVRLRTNKGQLPILVSLRGLSERKGVLQQCLREQIEFELGKRLGMQVPLNFLDNWALQANASWLILLDGFDEIVDNERRRMIADEIKAAAWPKDSTVVITSRPLPNNMFDESDFHIFSIIPFDSTQVAEFARAWFSNDFRIADQFQQQFLSLRLGALKGTPLAITIAAIVYQQTKSLHNEGRAQLYERYLETVFQEEEGGTKLLRSQIQESLGEAPGQKIFDQHRELVEEIARAQHEETKVIDAVAHYLFSSGVYDSIERAERKAETIFNLISRNVSLFNARAQSIIFEHVTFREYLSACAYIRNAKGESKELWKNVVSKWGDPAWKEVALFVLGILSIRDRTRQVVSQLTDALPKNGRDSLFFFIECLADKVPINQKRNQWVKAEFRELVSKELEREDPIRLRNLYEAVVESLRERAIAEDITRIALSFQVELSIRIDAARELGHHGHFDLAGIVWRSIINDEEHAKRWFETPSYPNLLEYVQPTIREGLPPWWLEGLQELEKTKQWGILLELVKDPKADIRVRFKGASILETGARKTVAIEAWLSILHDESLYPWWRHITAATALGRLGWQNDSKGNYD